MTAKPLVFGRDAQGYNAFAPPPASYSFSATLASSGNATITLPGDVARWIIAFSFTPGSSIWVAFNTNAAAPVGATFAATSSELNPGARILPSTITTSSGTSANTINLLNSGTGSASIWVGLYASP